ncbi:PAC2 family protein [Nigerium massiliense]|uniref:PAC2 family protein n=1 Tax=Nigerium massiliense TaxID=1522317 RepID=UPI00058DB240|nr:PAC2 family protein [Nigerium massiliense]
MLDPRELYTVHADQVEALAGRDLVMIHLLTGYIDAGGVTRNLAEHLLLQSPHQPVAEFDVDQLHDYRSRRPAMTFDVNRWADAEMPELTLDRVTDERGVDYLLLSGPEPDTQWKRAATAILDLAAALGVTRLVTATGAPFGVPHTRPVLVTEHSTAPDFVDENPVLFDRVQVPGSFAALLELSAGRRGMLARGFVTHVPHYLAQGSYPPAAVAGLTRLMDATGLALPQEPLIGTVQPTLDALSTEMGQDEDLPALVSALELKYDELERRDRGVPSAEEIGQAVEQFLAQQSDDEE